MKRVFEYAYRFVCVFIILMTIFSIMTIEVNTDHNHNYINNENNDKAVNSVYIRNDKLVFREPAGRTTKAQLTNMDTSNYNVLSSEYVNVSHFGPDCSGCGIGYVASGDYVGNGRINYSDKTYGVVRIVAADRKYPLGTIIRLTKGNDVTLAIVLDRGGGIGDGNKYQIDLLAESEAQSYRIGVIRDVRLDVLRIGH